MGNIKISLIGAGSGCFSIGLIRDLCSSQYLKNCTVSLMDVNEVRLNAIYDICNRFNNEIDGEIIFTKTMDRIESLKNADYVVNTALLAPHDRLKDGWKIAEKYGFKFGGSYHIMYDEAFWINFYQLRFMEEITEDILQYCPNAWHLMVSNPVISGTTHILRKYPQAKLVGLCHGYGMAYKIANELGYKREDLTYQIPGINHFIWMNEAKLKGENLYSILDKWIIEDASEYWTNCPPSSPLSKKRIDFYKKHGVLGIGDTLSWTGASWPWWYHSDDYTEKEIGEHSPLDGWNSYFNMVEENAQKIINLAKNQNASVSEFLKDVSTDDLMVPLLESLASDIPRVIIVNMLNKGCLVPGIPEDFEVEVPALCSASGIHGIQTSPLPKHMIAHILRDRVSPVEMELEAFNTGNITYLEELVLMDKWAISETQVKAFISEILELPYHKEMKEFFIAKTIR